MGSGEVMNPPKGWWDNHDNFVNLIHYLADTGWDAKDVAYAVEKPWKYETEFKEMLERKDEQ